MRREKLRRIPIWRIAPVPASRRHGPCGALAAPAGHGPKRTKAAQIRGIPRKGGLPWSSVRFSAALCYFFLPVLRFLPFLRRLFFRILMLHVLFQLTFAMDGPLVSCAGTLHQSGQERHLPHVVFLPLRERG